MSLVFYAEVVKSSLRKIHPEMLQDQLNKFKSRILKQGRLSKGWRMHNGDPVETEAQLTVVNENEETKERTEEVKAGFHYTAKVYLTCRSKGKRLDGIVRNEFEEIVKILQKTSKSKSWEVLSHGETDTYPGPDDPAEAVVADEGEGSAEDAAPVAEDVPVVEEVVA